jgi:RNA polymerase sigma-70 factor (ECF subfamily)
MTPLERNDLEQRIRRHRDEGDIDLAARAAIEGYRLEILNWLRSILSDDVAAHEVFCVFCEDLWKGLPSFRWGCTFRTWAYQLARNAACRRFRSPCPELPMGDALPNEPMREPRSRTRPWLRTDVKSEFAELREMLDPEDRMILILRVDRQMQWQDVARVMSDAQGPLTSDELKKKATALRQQFQRVKKQLREMAQTRGLLKAEQ